MRGHLLVAIFGKPALPIDEARCPVPVDAAPRGVSRQPGPEALAGTGPEALAGTGPEALAG